MKQILIILGLLASVSTFAQSPRIKLNQITKDTVKGSVLISSPSDSGMVYSRDFYIAYGLTDTVLILYGDTISGGTGLSSVLSDGVTITGNGTSGNELKVDTSLIATIKALNDSLATISASTTPDGVTITGDGSVGNPLKVDTATVISTIKGLVDTLSARGYLTANQTITLSGDVTGSGTTAITATVVDDSHNHIISNVDFLQDSLDAKANDSDLANYVTLSGAETITGAKTFTNTFTQSGGDANFDSGTLFVDESENRVGIMTTNPGVPLEVNGNARFNGLSIGTYNASNTPIDLKFNSSSAQIFRFWNEGTGGAKMRFISDDNVEASHQWTVSSAWLAQIAAKYDSTNQNNNYMDFRVRGASDAGTEAGLIAATKMRILGNGNVGIGTSSPAYKLSLKDSIGFEIYSSAPSALDAIKAVTGGNGAVFGVQNRNPTGYSGVEYINNLGQPKVFSGYNNSTEEFRLNNFSTNGYIDFMIGSSSKMRIANNGNVGIGTTSPSEKLDVNGNARFRSIGSGASAGALHYTSTGVLTTNTSDARLKTNLQPLENTLNKLLGINTYTFNWIDETDRVDLGMIAQEVEQIFPNLVFTNNFDGYKGIHYDKFSSILTKAIQEQQAIIETQEQKLTDLETTIQSLITRIEILENK